MHPLKLQRNCDIWKSSEKRLSTTESLSLICGHRSRLRGLRALATANLKIVVDREGWTACGQIDRAEPSTVVICYIHETHKARNTREQMQPPAGIGSGVPWRKA